MREDLTKKGDRGDLKHVPRTITDYTVKEYGGPGDWERIIIVSPPA
jgi:hypothetical protein